MIYENLHIQNGKVGGVPVKFKDENPSYLISPKGQMLVASPHNPQFPLTHEFLSVTEDIIFYLPANCL